MFKKLFSGKLFILMAVLVLTLALTGQLFAAAPSVALKGKTIRVLALDASTGQAMKKAFVKLEKKYGFKIELDLVPWSSYIEKAMMSASSGVYDVIDANGEWVLPGLVAGNNVLPLDSFVKQDNYDLKGYSPLGLALTYWPKGKVNKPNPAYYDWKNGRLMALPSHVESTPLCYRTDYFEEAGIAGPPKNWDEFLKTAQKLTGDRNGDGQIDTWGWGISGVIAGGQLYDDWVVYANSYGVDILDANGKPAFNTKAAQEATQFWVDLYQKHKVVPPGSLNYVQGNMADSYKAGSMAMVRVWGNTVSVIEDPNSSQAAGKTGYTVMPVEKRVAARGMTWAYVIPKNAKNPKLAWEFIKLANSEDVQKELMPECVPSRTNLLQLGKITYKNLSLPAIADTFLAPGMALQPLVPNVLELADQAIAPSLQKALTGKMSVSEALSEAYKNASKLMSSSK